MATPTRDSRASFPLSNEVQTFLSQLAALRRLVVAQQSVLSSVASIRDIIDDIWVPIVGENGYLDTLRRVRDLPGFNAEFLTQVGLRFSFGPGNVNVGNNRINIGENGFAVDDPVRFEEDDVLPGGLATSTTYFILEKPTAGTITLSDTVQGSELDITSDPTGQNVVRYALSIELNDLDDAMDAVLDEIDNVIPVTATTLEIRAQILDKTAVATSGLVDATLEASALATLRTRLLDLQNEIEAPS